MTSVLASFHRTLRPFPLSRVALQPRSAWRVRAIHATPAALKRNPKPATSASDEDDLFGDFAGASDSLFSDDIAPSKPSVAPGSPSSSATISPHNPSTSGSLKLNRKAARFEQLYGFAHACLVTKTETKRQIRSSVWIYLFHLARTPEQLDRVAEMFPKWRDAQRTFRPSTCVAFARLALKVFGNRPKYGLDLSLESAQIVLHSLHRWQNHKEIVAFASLLSVYNLPPVSSDLLTNALLLKALIRKPTKDSTAMVYAMIPSLKRLMEKTRPESLEKWGLKKTWLAYALRRIEDALREQGSKHEWISQWMKDGGHFHYRRVRGLWTPAPA